MKNDGSAFRLESKLVSEWKKMTLKKLNERKKRTRKKKDLLRKKWFWDEKLNEEKNTESWEGKAGLKGGKKIEGKERRKKRRKDMEESSNWVSEYG